jgi:hypothetical protein
MPPNAVRNAVFGVDYYVNAGEDTMSRQQTLTDKGVTKVESKPPKKLIEVLIKTVMVSTAYWC